ncbi:C6 zinc finger domain containing protein [Seiridium cupressi]
MHRRLATPNNPPKTPTPFYAKHNHEVTSGPADFELLASTASQAIHRRTQRGETPTAGRALDTAPAISYDAVPGLEECGQAGAELRSTPIPSYDYTAQTCPEAIVSLTGYHSPCLPTRTPMIIDATPATPTSCPVDVNRRTASSVTDSGWVGEDHYTPTMTSLCMSSPTVSRSSEVSLDQFMMLGSPAAGLVDYPTFLVQHWFSSVCCYWSAFDSESNPFRSVAASLWGSSGIVFYSLQSMSAAALVEFMPDMKGIASSAPLLAVEAISEELAELYTAETDVLQFPKGLMLGLFCMGSSMCWDDPQKTGALFFRQARRLLRHYQLRSESLSEEDRQLLEFFRGCIKYEEMLRHVAGEREAIVPQRASQSENCKRQLSMKPHAWTGVSPDLLGLFGDVISLCRRECARRQGQTITRESLSQALDAIDAAQALEEALLVEPTVIQPDDQQPDDTRWVHLRDTTESYRIASLLQLYQTFPDLYLADAARTTLDDNPPKDTPKLGFAMHSTSSLSVSWELPQIQRVLPIFNSYGFST